MSVTVEGYHNIDAHHRVCMGMLDAATICPWDSHRIPVGVIGSIPTLFAEYSSEQIRLIAGFMENLDRNDENAHIRLTWLQYKLEQHALMQRQWVLADYSHIKAVEFTGYASRERRLQWTPNNVGQWEPIASVVSACDILPSWVGILPPVHDWQLKGKHGNRVSAGCIACNVGGSGAVYSDWTIMGPMTTGNSIKQLVCGDYHPLCVEQTQQTHLLDKYAAILQTVKQYHHITQIERVAPRAPVWITIRRMTGTPHAVRLTDIGWNYNDSRSQSHRPRDTVSSAAFAAAAQSELPTKRSCTGDRDGIVSNHPNNNVPLAMIINL